MYTSNFERKEIEIAYGNFKVLFYYNFTKEKKTQNVGEMVQCVKCLQGKPNYLSLTS